VIGQQLVVVADAHLGAPASNGDEPFLAFLDAVPALGDSLLLAGDIYDFWFTYRRLIPRHSIRITARLIELARRIPGLMSGGNHDRWGDEFWDAETGITFDRRQLRFEIGERTVLAIHGDGLHEERPSAASLNRLLDTRAVITAFDLLPAAVGFAIARRLGHDPAFAAAHPEVIDTAAARQERWALAALARDPSINTLVMGHTHRAALSPAGTDRWYLNPGAWLGEHRYSIIDANGPRQETFR
jgi:UDP-2,3-diacylglucosamine hydrolase